MGKGRELVHLLTIAALIVGFASACFLSVPQAAALEKQPFRFPASDNETAVPSGLVCPGGIMIDNGILNIELNEKGECCGDFWLYPDGHSNVYQETPFFSYGGHAPVTLNNGSVTQCFPLTGSPDTWYESIIYLDLDGGGFTIAVHRWIMVPSNESYFLVRYTIDNLKGGPLSNFRIFQGVDYDIGVSFSNNEGGYVNDFVWEHDLGTVGTYVGFRGDSPSAHHDVSLYPSMWTHIINGILNDANYANGDVSVAMEWDVPELPSEGSVTRTLTFAFAPSWDELNSIFTTGPTQETISPQSSSPPSEIPPMRLKQAILSTSYASVTPTQTYANQPVTIAANVVNSGDDTGNYNVVLKINGQVEQSKMVSVGPGGAYQVKFTVSKSEPGQYLATIDGHKADFMVLGDKTSKPTANSGIIVLVVTGILVLSIATVLMLSFRRPT